MYVILADAVARYDPWELVCAFNPGSMARWDRWVLTDEVGLVWSGQNKHALKCTDPKVTIRHALKSPVYTDQETRLHTKHAAQSPRMFANGCRPMSANA